MVGLQSITDGEFRRGSWFFGFVQAVDGLTTKDSLFDFHDASGDHATFQAPYVTASSGAHAASRPMNSRSRGRRPTQTPKVTMPTPSLVHFFRGNDSVSRDAYPHLEDFWTDLFAVYREEIAALAALGCTLCAARRSGDRHAVRPEDSGRRAARPVSTPRSSSRPIFRRSIPSCAARPPGMTVALHLCKGNYKGHWMAEGSYEAVSEQLFNETDVDTFFLEYESERAGGFEPLRHVPKGQECHPRPDQQQAPELEPLDVLRRRVDQAGQHIALDQLGVSPQCGFASSVGGNPLSIDDERRKLARVVELADAVWG